MTLELRPPKVEFLPRFYRLAAVAVLSNMMVPLAGLADTAFLGHLTDIRYLGGVILGSLLFDYLYRVLKFLRNSTNAMTAEAVGAADQQAVMLALLRSGLVAIAIALTILLLQLPIRTLGFAVLSGSPNLEASGLDYFNARIWGAPAVLLNFVILGWFVGQERNAMVLIISLVANLSNVLLDYWMIVQWGWASAGAGLATALSQYLALGVGSIAIATQLDHAALRSALPQILQWDALKATLGLKGNILIRFLVLISTYAIFTNLSAALGTGVLASNGLLLQIALLSQFTVQGVGMTAQTLIGQFKGQGNLPGTLAVLWVALLHAVAIAASFALAAFCFPAALFGLLTSHGDVTQVMEMEMVWLLPLLVCTAIAFMLEGYFIGLKQGAALRNAALIGFGIGFAPLAIAGLMLQSSGLLWSALVGYMAVVMVSLTVLLKRQLSPQASRQSIG